MSTILTLRHYRDELLAHSHAYGQLVFGLSGCLELAVGGRTARIERQDLTVVPPEEHHACASHHGSHCLVLDVPDEDWLRDSLGAHFDAGRRLLERPGRVELAPVQSQLVGWIASAPLTDALIAEQSARLLLASLAVPATPLAASELPLAALDAHIDRQLAHPLQVADLARLSGLSVAHFHSRFLAATGQTPMDYVRRRRLRQGRQLLLESTLGVGEIAARVGYSSQSAFTAALAREFGVTPRELRRRGE
ncbi:helix-turn-helix transcriptional regulator [Pseudomonas oryzae]|uniref:Transcriptional regulator, AraC family n=1 Tax=Pseudomonas oryzae TaxID=1392877 RepID=A0A1H1SUY4_9PSED|nr:AraC family transcriptional regulator [Pseudomonas oryzae]SDS51643.1 transcriptional regulator, AraC family [Pseudomonas oryzae]